MAPSGISLWPSPRGCPTTRSARCSRSAPGTSRRSRSFRKRAPSGGRASSGSRAGSRLGKKIGAPMWKRCRPRSAARSRFRSGHRSLHLSARADRIERLPGGDYAILDYKTGQVPTGRQVMAGLSPQLTLEGAILRAGAFADIAPGASIAALVYVSLKGGDPGGEEKLLDFKDSSPDAAGRPRPAEARRGGAAVRGSGDALPVARAADVPGPRLWGLRSSGAGEGMVALGRRRRRGGGHR